MQTLLAADLDVAQIGRGRDLILFHSLLTDRTVFDRVVPTLSVGRRLTLVNLPGFGASAPAGPRIEDYADRVAGLVPALGLPRTTDLRPALGAITNPTLVIVGALDTTTPPALARELAAGIRGARLVEIPGCAHCPPIETPDAFVAALGDFL